MVALAEVTARAAHFGGPPIRKSRAADIAGRRGLLTDIADRYDEAATPSAGSGLVVAGGADASLQIVPSEVPSISSVVDKSTIELARLRAVARERCQAKQVAQKKALSALQEWSSSQETNAPVAIAVLPSRVSSMLHWHIAPVVAKFCKQLASRLSNNADSRSLLAEVIGRWQRLHNTIRHEQCPAMAKRPAQTHVLCQRYGKPLCTRAGRALLSFQKTLNSHFRKALRKDSGILRPFYNEATLVWKFSMPTLSAEPPVWAHVSYVNLTTLMGAWAKMKEDSDSVNGRTAVAVGHCSLVPDIADMVMHPLGLHLTLDFVDNFLDRRFPLRCSAWSLRASQLPQPRRLLLGGEQIVFPLPWSKLVWDPACLVANAKGKKSDDPSGVDADIGDGASGSSSGDEDGSAEDDSSNNSGSESDGSTDMAAEALRAATQAEREARKRCHRTSGDDSDGSLFMGDDGGCGGGDPAGAPTGVAGGSEGDGDIGVDVLGPFVEEILPEPLPDLAGPPASPTPAAAPADPAASSSDERVRHERYHNGVQWNYVPVTHGWIVFAPGHNQIHAHCDIHKGILKCRCHKTISVGRQKGRPMGLLLLWLAKSGDTDHAGALLHHSKEFKKLLAMPEFHMERSIQRTTHKGNPDLADVWHEEAEKENPDDDSEFETVK